MTSGLSFLSDGCKHDESTDNFMIFRSSSGGKSVTFMADEGVESDEQDRYEMWTNGRPISDQQSYLIILTWQLVMSGDILPT